MSATGVFTAKLIQQFMKSVICITGCTATGKSRIAKEIAKIRPSVIINADSVQVYRCMRVLSSRPSEDDFENLERPFCSSFSQRGGTVCGLSFQISNKIHLES